MNNNIRKLRKEHHLTQKELADLVGVSSKTVERWEKGADLWWHECVLLGRAFNCEIEELLPDFTDISDNNASKDPGEDPRQPLEDSSIKDVMQVVTKDEELFLHFSQLRERYNAGEDVIKELITFGYLIGKESQEDEEK